MAPSRKSHRGSQNTGSTGPSAPSLADEDFSTLEISVKEGTIESVSQLLDDATFQQNYHYHDLHAVMYTAALEDYIRNTLGDRTPQSELESSRKRRLQNAMSGVIGEGEGYVGWLDKPERSGLDDTMEQCRATVEGKIYQYLTSQQETVAIEVNAFYAYAVRGEIVVIRLFAETGFTQRVSDRSGKILTHCLNLRAPPRPGA